MKNGHICQLPKESATNARLYLPLHIPERPWTNRSTDFVLGLPRTQKVIEDSSDEDANSRVNSLQPGEDDVD
jgi:hypothetical protein